MIREALLHCRQIGPVRLDALRARGIRTWEELLARAEELPGGYRDGVVDEVRRCITAEAAGDVGYFVERLAPPDRWRILSHYLDRVSFLDLETTGLEVDDRVTVIGLWHRGALRLFVEHEDLDDFLDLLDEVELLATFNGSGFDVPRLLDAFHVPGLPCPHLDLRWVLYHLGHRGPLSAIEAALEGEGPGEVPGGGGEGAASRWEPRPVDVRGVDGAQAVSLWEDWRQRGDAGARARLLRYCGADVLALVRLAHRVAGTPLPPGVGDWSALPEAPTPPAPPGPAERKALRNMFRDLARKLRREPGASGRGVIESPTGAGLSAP